MEPTSRPTQIQSADLGQNKQAIQQRKVFSTTDVGTPGRLCARKKLDIGLTPFKILTKNG